MSNGQCLLSLVSNIINKTKYSINAQCLEMWEMEYVNTRLAKPSKFSLPTLKCTELSEKNENEKINEKNKLLKFLKLTIGML